MVRVLKIYFNMDNQSDIRRITLKEGDEFTSAALCDRMRQIWPQAKTKEDDDFKITWKDNEGDEVTISTDDELRECLRNSEDGVMRLHVAVRGKRRKRNVSPVRSRREGGHGPDEAAFWRMMSGRGRRGGGGSGRGFGRGMGRFRRSSPWFYDLTGEEDNSGVEEIPQESKLDDREEQNASGHEGEKCEDAVPGTSGMADEVNKEDNPKADTSSGSKRKMPWWARVRWADPEMFASGTECDSDDQDETSGDDEGWLWAGFPGFRRWGRGRMGGHGPRDWMMGQGGRGGLGCGFGRRGRGRMGGHNTCDWMMSHGGRGGCGFGFGRGRMGSTMGPRGRGGCGMSGPWGRHGKHGPWGRKGEHEPCGHHGVHGLQEHQGRHGPWGRHSEHGPWGRHSEHGPWGRHGKQGPWGRHGEHGPWGRHGEHGPWGRHGEHRPWGRNEDSECISSDAEPNMSQGEHGPWGRHGKHAPWGRPSEKFRRCSGASGSGSSSSEESDSECSPRRKHWIKPFMMRRAMRQAMATHKGARFCPRGRHFGGGPKMGFGPAGMMGGGPMRWRRFMKQMRARRLMAQHWRKMMKHAGMQDSSSDNESDNEKLNEKMGKHTGSKNGRFPWRKAMMMKMMV